jgi:hypothetical protein
LLKKHPTLGKKKLANMYFLTKKEKTDNKSIELNSPINNEISGIDEYVKFKNTK